MLLHFDSRLLTIGYEGLSAEEVVETLAQHEASTLIDVRLTPISRKPGLSKTRLSALSATAGIEYLHLRELGNPKDNREGFRKQSNQSIDRYFRLLKGAPAKVALEEVASRLACGSVALLCYERDHLTCHRKLIVEEVSRQLLRSPKVLHIAPNSEF